MRLRGRCVPQSTIERRSQARDARINRERRRRGFDPRFDACPMCPTSSNPYPIAGGLIKCAECGHERPRVDGDPVFAGNRS